MNTMKKLLTALLCGAMVLSMAACGGSDSESAEGTGSDDNKIYVGTEAGFAPYEYMSGDEVVGVDMDIAQAIADAMGKELVIKNMDFDGALNAVQQGQVDFVAAAVSVDEERQKVMDFSHNYVDSSDVVVVNASAGVVNTNEDIADKVIGVQQGNIADIWVTDNYPDAEVKRYTKFVQAAEDLKNNKIDAIVMDLYPAQELVAANPELKILDENNPLFVDQYAIAVKKGNQELLDQINEVIDQLIADRFLDMYDLDEHVEKIKDVYRKRRDVMLKTMEETFPKEVKFTHPEGGLFTWCVLPEYMDAKVLAQQCLEKKVAYVPGGSFFPNGGKENHFRLNYSCMPEDKIKEGITRIAEVLKANLK